MAAEWIRMALIIAAGVGGCVAIERAGLNDTPKLGFQGAIVLAVGAIVLRFAGVV